MALRTKMKYFKIKKPSIKWKAFKYSEMELKSVTRINLKTSSIDIKNRYGIITICQPGIIC